MASNPSNSWAEGVRPLPRARAGAPGDATANDPKTPPPARKAAAVASPPPMTSRRETRADTRSENGRSPAVLRAVQRRRCGAWFLLVGGHRSDPQEGRYAHDISQSWPAGEPGRNSEGRLEERRLGVRTAHCGDSFAVGQYPTVRRSFTTTPPDGPIPLAEGPLALSVEPN